MAYEASRLLWKLVIQPLKFVSSYSAPRDGFPIPPRVPESSPPSVVVVLSSV